MPSDNLGSHRALFSLTQKIFVIKCYYKHGESASLVLRGLNRRFGKIFRAKDGLGGIRQIVDAFETSGSVQNAVYHQGIEGSTEVYKPERLCDEEVIIEEELDESGEKDDEDQEGFDVEEPEEEEQEDDNDPPSDVIVGEDSADDLTIIGHQPTSIRPSKLVLCDDCGNYIPKRGLHSHMKLHKVRTPDSVPEWKCDVCDKKLSTKNNLLNHKRRHLSSSERAADQIICEICAKVSYSKELHKSHMRVSIGRGIPSVALITFIHKIIIISQVHSEDRPHDCPMCEMKFRSAQTLARHKLTHTGEKPLICNICGASFRAHMTLSMHMRLHTGERPYSCNHCQKTFVGRPGLNVMMSTIGLIDRFLMCISLSRRTSRRRMAKNIRSIAPSPNVEDDSRRRRR